MDTIRFLLGIVLKLALALLLAALVVWLMKLFYPSLQPTSLFKTDVFSRDWLPAPKNYAGLLGAPNKTGMHGNVYVPGPAYNGYAASQNNSPGNTYSQPPANNQVFTGNTTAYAERSLYVRNLSVYEGGNISQNFTFIGEARDSMFKNGTFQIIVLDRNGTIVGAAQAVGTGAWAPAGWVRFQAAIHNKLPSGAECALVFLSANQPVKVGLAVRCN